MATVCSGKCMQYNKRLHGNQIHDMDCITTAQMPLAVGNSN